MRKYGFRWLLLALFVLASPVMAQVTGPATVIDGDTIEIRGQRLRLFGVDAPEADQTCLRGGQPYKCGLQAGAVLAETIGENPVTCQPRDKVTQNGVAAAICRSGRHELGAHMAALGWALALPAVSRDYLDEEDLAKHDERGLWRGAFVAAWEWRQGLREPTLGQGRTAGVGCRIKATVVGQAKERIYHVPGGQAYGTAIVTPARGDRWFCTENDARAAGWKKSPR